MGKSTHTSIVLCLVTIGLLITSLAQAQTAGKEEIAINLPAEYRWKKNRVRKDTPSIREFTYNVSGRNAEHSPVKSIRINTIDRRYFPMSSISAPTDKLNFLQQTCPEATLHIVDRRMVETRNSVLFSIRSNVDGYCGETVFLSLASEGPTAYHTIELEIEKTSEIEAELTKWSNILLEAIIK